MPPCEGLVLILCSTVESVASSFVKTRRKGTHEWVPLSGGG